MKRLARLFFVLGLALSVVPSVLANEGPEQYANGSENWYAGMLPPPGLYYINYLGYYSGQLKNGSGNNVKANGAVPMVQATYNAFRFCEVTKLKFLGGEYAVHVVIPVVYQSMNLNGRNGATSVGDITIDPFILGWNRSTWHAVVGFDINLPTGAYNNADPRVSLSAHYYGFEPVFAFSYLPKSGWEASSKLMYNIKTTNQATNYHSGADFHMDYAAGKHLGNWMLGASGYALAQTGEDTVDGQTVPAIPGMWSTGRKAQVFAIGPSVGYTNSYHMTFVAQWQHELAVANRFGGDRVLFKAVIPTSSILHGLKQ
jgi:hypothetical protein